MSYQIRTITVEDVPAVYRLGLCCYDVLDKPYNYWSLTGVARYVESHSGTCQVAVDAGTVVGFALGTPQFELLADTGHLEWVAVAPKYRRQGIAHALMRAAEDAMRGAGVRRMVTDISTANEASRAMARSLGYTESISVTFFTRDL